MWFAWGMTSALATGCAVESGTPDEGRSADAAGETAGATSQAVLLHELRLSPTRTTQFWELAPGEVVVVSEGSLENDAPPSEADSKRTALEIFSALSSAPPPEKLVQAQKRADEIDALWAQRVSAPDIQPGLGGVKPSERVQVDFGNASARQFLGAAWWESAACSEAGYTQKFNISGEWYYPYIACWSDLMRFVNSGSVGIARDWEARFAGVTTNASYKHFYITCTNYVLFTDCHWDVENYSVNVGFWKTVTAGARKTRAGELHTPNDAGGGYFSLKFNGTSLLLGGNFCRNDVEDCTRWPHTI